MHHLRNGLILALSLGTLAGCDGDKRPLSEYSPVPQPPEFQAISGTITGWKGR